ncbi:MAG: DUF177 domain-containing protein [Candidatus Magnetoovum sp. WYHC-5]|nr:DUF177 domain-containing protein [Candidatus Magnetoovum sp. WYHC-5]
MKILFKNILESGFSCDFELTVDESHVPGPVRGVISIQRAANDTFYLSGSARYIEENDCNFCLTRFSTEKTVQFSFVYMPLEAMNNDVEENAELAFDDLDVCFYKKEEIDVKGLLREQILLNTNMYPVCRQGCQGLCTVCGTNLNVEKCSCVKLEVDERFSKLKELFKK